LHRPELANAPPILGLPSAPTANAASQFIPDRALQNQELLSLIPPGLSGDLADQSAQTITLKVMVTPGHAANHVCLVMVEDGLLISGDHILNGSTTIINPPDGAMTAYLDSLDSLSAACQQHHIEYILPAHGYVLGFAEQAIAQLKNHRLKREAKVKAAMQALPEGDPDSWVALAYDDTPEQLWPIAKRSLLAHVKRLRELGGA
jgi:glyoxylase-like metal-dependent hydrolase (beta-lactamase superfamily II)